MEVKGLLLTLPRTLLLLVIMLFSSLQAQQCDTVTSLGLADPNTIPNSKIVTSSEAEGHGKEQIRLNCCEGTYDSAWCPDPKDKQPFVEIHLDKPVSIGEIDIQAPKMSQTTLRYPDNYMKTFDLVIKFAGINQLVSVAQNVSAIANASVSLNRISLYPTVFTDVIRIEPRDSENLPCFRMELFQCEATSMCPRNFCQNNGTCSQPNMCDCPDAYYGERCQYSKESIPLTVYKFLQIIGDTIVTASHNLTFHGNMSLENQSVLVVQPGGYLNLLDFSQSSCFLDLDKCTSGFTINIVFSISHLDTNSIVVLSNGGADDSRIRGITLLFQQGNIHCYASTSEKLWTVVTQFTLAEATWYKMTISWSLNLGLIVLQDRELVGSTFIPQTLDTPASRTNLLRLGNWEETSTSVLHFKGITMVPLDWQEFQRADLDKVDEDNFIDRSWDLRDISQLVIESHNWYLNLIGKPAFGEDGVTLTRIDQFIEIADIGSSCLTDPSLCTDGLTLKITIKLATIEEDSIIFTTGGEYKNHPGVTLLYRYGQFHAIVSTESLSWFVSVSRTTILTRDFCDIILSWSQHKSLKLIINQVLVGESASPIPHTNTTLPYIDKLTIGIGITECVISELHIWHSHVELLSQRGLIFCIPCSTPPTTSVTTAQTQPSTSAQSTGKTTREAPWFTDSTTEETTPYYYEDECPPGCVASDICFQVPETPSPEPTPSCDLTTQGSSPTTTAEDATTQQKITTASTVTKSTPPRSTPTLPSLTTRASTTTSTSIVTTKPPCPLPTACPNLTTNTPSLPSTTVTSSTNPQPTSTPGKLTTQPPSTVSTTDVTHTNEPQASPKTTAQQTTAPQTTAPKTTVPETTAPQTTAQRTTEPQTTVPQTTVQETTTHQTTPQSSSTTTEKQTTPKCTSSESCPTLATSSTSLPPATTVTDATTPRTKTPQTTIQETTAPQTTARQTTVPQTTVPQTTAPQTTAPQTTAPQTTAPQTTAPQTTAPQTTILETTAPQTSSSSSIITDSTTEQPQSSSTTTEKQTTPKCTSSESCPTSATSSTSLPPATTVTDATTPSIITPQTTTPQTTAPRTTVPQTTAPQTTARQTTAPQTTESQTTSPQTIAPQTTEPQTTAPPTIVPQTTVPQTTAPQTTLTTEKPTTPKCTSSETCPTVPTSNSSLPPATTVTEATTPPTTAPQTLAPQTTTSQTAPHSTVPQTTAPKTTLQETTAPQTTVHETISTQTSTSSTTKQPPSSSTTTEKQTTPKCTSSESCPTLATSSTSLPPATTGTEATTPPTTAPQTTAQQTTTPQTTVQETTTPKTAPHSTVPQTTAPQTTVQETPAPQTTVQETTAPQTTVQETTAPQTTVQETISTQTVSSTTESLSSSSTTTEKQTTPKCTSSESCPTVATSSTSLPPATTVTDTTTPTTTIGQTTTPATIIEDSTTQQPQSSSTTEKPTTPKCTSSESCPTSATSSSSLPPATTTTEATTPSTTAPPTTAPQTTAPQTTVQERTPPQTTVQETTAPQTTVQVTTSAQTSSSSSSSAEQSTTTKCTSSSSCPTSATSAQSSPPTSITDTTLPPSSPTTATESTTPQPPTPTTTKATTTTRRTTAPSTTTKQPCPQPPSSVTLIPEVSSSGQGLLICSVSAAPEPGIKIKFTWTIEGSSVQWSKEIEAPERSASISAAEINVQILNRAITCTAEVRYSTPNAEWCWPERSNVVVPSIKCPPVNGTIRVIEGREEQILQVQVTVPPSLLCRPEDGGQCRVEVTTTITTTSNELKCSAKEIIPQAVLGVSTVGQSGTQSCGVAITSGNWQNAVTIPIKATVDGVIDGNRNRKLQISVRIIGQITSITSFETCGEIDVVVIDRGDGATCSSVNDPHIKSWDNLRYNNFLPGEFVLANHKYLQYEVRALYSPCNPRQPKGATCNCGAAVRSGDDVITFDTCNTRQNQITSGGTSVITVDMYKNGELTPGTRVIRHGCGQKYEVVLPTRTKVVITSSVKPFLNINLQASSYDFESTEGLCGDFNNNPSDDLGGLNIKNPDAFNKQWLRNVTIFKGVPAFTTPARPTFCSCQSGQQPVCKPGLDVYICYAAATEANDITAALVSQAKTPLVLSQVRTSLFQVQSRGRRAVDTTNLQNPAASSVVTGFTSETALQYCQEYLENSTAVQNCLSHLKYDTLNESIRNCVEDLTADNDTQWATSHVDDLIVECLADVQANITTWENNENEDGPNIPQYINSSLCTQNCGEHGSCINSICECKEGWTGETCQIGSATTPTVLSAMLACDVMTASCNRILVEGNNFVSTKNLTCRIRYITVGDKVSVTGEEYTVPAIFISMIQVVCPENIASSLQSRSALVTLSNNGVTYSETNHIHIVHKSTCQTCTLTDDVNAASCTWNPGSCVIDNQCYARFEPFEANTCYRCDPDVSLNKWTKISDPNCTLTQPEVGEFVTEPADNTTIIALGVVCGVLVLVAVGVIIAVVVRSRRRSSKLQRLWEGDPSLDIYHRRAIPSSADVSGQSDAARINAFYNPALSSSIDVSTN